MTDPTPQNDKVPIKRPALLWIVLSVVIALTAIAVWRLTVGL